MPLKVISGDIDRMSGDLSYEGSLKVEGSIRRGQRLKVSGDLLVLERQHVNDVSGAEGVAFLLFILLRLIRRRCIRQDDGEDQSHTATLE